MPREAGKRLIINADDLGFSPGVNAAVLACAIRGSITAASVMVNMPYAEDILPEIRQACPDFSLGLHFTLTSGPAASPPAQIPLLVDEAGMFRHGFFALRRLTSSPKTRQPALSQIKIELDAQLAKMAALTQKYALRCDHLDSHQHIHTLPGVLEMCLPAACERNLVLRIPRERYGTARRVLRRLHAWFPAGILKKILLQHYTRRETPPMAYFGVLESGKMTLPALREIIRTLDGGLPAEINVHPSAESLPADVPCSAADKAFHASPWRQREFDALMAPEFTACLEENAVRLTGFASANERATTV